MDMNQIIDVVCGFDGFFVIILEVGSDFLELLWGDVYFYYVFDGWMFECIQFYGMIIMKDYFDDIMFVFDILGRFCVNIYVGCDVVDLFVIVFEDFVDEDVFYWYFFYGVFGWVCVIDFGECIVQIVFVLFWQVYEDVRICVEC